jgi:ATP-binding cassette subfamily B multidrug efflux pump
MKGQVQKDRGLDARLLKRLSRFLLPHKGMALLALLLILAASALDTAIPLVTRHAIDVDMSNGDLDGLLQTVLLFLGLAIGAFVLRYLQQIVTGWIGQTIVLEIRSRLFRRVQELHLAWYDRNPVGQVMSRLTNDVETLNEVFTGGLILIFQDLLLLLMIAAALLWMDWRLALVLFCVIPLIFVASFTFKRLTRAAFRRVRALVGEVNTFLQETITGISVIQLFRQEARLKTRFDGINDRLLGENIRTIFYFAVFFPLMELLGSLATAAILWAGAERVLSGVLSFGALVAFLQYAEKFFRPIRDLAEKYNILQSAMAAAERVFELLDQKPAIKGGTVGAVDGQPAPDATGEIVFDGVWFAYNDENWVLRDLSFTVKPGSSTALVGYTGAGKTSITGLLQRFYEFQKGSITVDGVDIRAWDLKALRERMAIVLQDVFLFSGSVTDNIRMGRALSDEELSSAVSQTGLDRVLAGRSDGLDSAVGERGQLLSGGQRQLVSFSRALASKPSILILDEATSSVDSISEELIQQAIETLLAGRSSLVIAHRLSTIMRADQILVLHRGQVVERGRHLELLALKGVYHRLWQLEQQKEPGHAA